MSAGYVSYSPWFKTTTGTEVTRTKTIGFKTGIFFFVLISIKTIFMCVTLFATFSGRHCTTYDGVIFPNVTFFGRRKQSTFNFFCFS